MDWDDKSREAEADKLEGLLITGDNNALQNELQALSRSDPNGFNKTLDLFKQKNEADHAVMKNLPEVEISKEWFGFGGSEQVVVKDSSGQKQEVWESAAHRQKELEEDPNSIGRAWRNMVEQGKWSDLPDYQKDSTRGAIEDGNVTREASGDVTVDHRSNDGQTHTNLSPDELQRLINEGKY